MPLSASSAASGSRDGPGPCLAACAVPGGQGRSRATVPRAEDKVYRRDVLWRAWETVRRNSGAPGIDRTTLADVEEYGVARLLDELAAELREGGGVRCRRGGCSSRSPGTKEQRPLSIPTVADRIVQAAMKIVLEPVFEADLLACSFGFRPKRSAHDALQVLIDESWRGSRWVVETDIANCFEAIPHREVDAGGRRNASVTRAC